MEKSEGAIKFGGNLCGEGGGASMGCPRGAGSWTEKSTREACRAGELEGRKRVHFDLFVLPTQTSGSEWPPLGLSCIVRILIGVRSLQNPECNGKRNDYRLPLL